MLTTLAFGASVVIVAALAAGCGGSGSSGSSGSTPAVGQGGATSMQVLTKVQRGDLVESATGSAKLVVAKGKTTVVATVPQQSAASVAVGQTATVTFVRAPTNGQSGAPFGQNGQGAQASPPAGQGGFGQGGSGGGSLRERGTPGTVTTVNTNADGSAAVTIAVKKLPANVTAKSVGFASIQTKVLAGNVIVIPTAAIKGSGSSATVQVLAGGQTSTRSVVVGQQAGTQSEIVSGLSVGENVVWERSFQGGGFFGNGGSPSPGQTSPAAGGGQSGGGFQ